MINLVIKNKNKFILYFNIAYVNSFTLDDKIIPENEF